MVGTYKCKNCQRAYVRARTIQSRAPVREVSASSSLLKAQGFTCPVCLALIGAHNPACEVGAGGFVLCVPCGNAAALLDCDLGRLDRLRAALTGHSLVPTGEVVTSSGERVSVRDPRIPKLAAEDSRVAEQLDDLVHQSVRAGRE